MCGNDKACGCGCEEKPSRASARHEPASRERDVVLTDRAGRTFDPPRRADFRTVDEYLDAYDDYRRRVSEAMSSRGMQLSLERDRDLYAEAKRHGAALDRASAQRGRRARRDPPSEPSPTIVGGLYYLEWDAHDEGDEGTYVYEGVYPPTGAGMFRRVAPNSRQRITLYLFRDEVRYLELLKPPHASGPRGVPAPRSRTAPQLLPGRVLTRHAYDMPRVWDEGIVGPSIARAAQFQGFRRIDDAMFAVWRANGVLYAQPRRS